MERLADRRVTEQQLLPSLVLTYYRENRQVAEPSRLERQRLVTAAVVLVDILIALLIWYAASAGHGSWGRGDLSESTHATVVSAVTVWVVLRALLGLYPGYGLDRAEELRRQTYGVLGTVAAVAVFALAFQMGDGLSRLHLAALISEPLVLCPSAAILSEAGVAQDGVLGQTGDDPGYW